METLVIVANLGHLKAWRLVPVSGNPSDSPKFEDVSDTAFEVLHSRFANRDTDQAGRFPDRASSSNIASSGMSIGERHGETQEVRRIELERLAIAINELVDNVPGIPIFFAAPQPVHKELMGLLSKDTQERISKNLHLDLVKVEKRKLLEHFSKEEG